MDDYFGKIVVLAPTKERKMSEFKIGDEITCIDNSGVVLTLGKNYIVTGVRHTEYTSLLHLFNDVGKENSYFPTRFILASNIESSATQTEIMVEISQNEYDEMQDRIELLESLLVDANNRIADLEYSLDVTNQVLTNFFRLTQLVSTNDAVADLLNAKLGDDVVDKIHAYLLNAVNNK